MKLYLKKDPLIDEYGNGKILYFLADSEDDSSCEIDVTPEERAILDKAERLFLDLQGFIDKKIKGNHA